MSIMAKYSRIFWANPADEDVAKRNRAIAGIQAWLKGLNSAAAVDVAAVLANAIAGDSLPTSLTAPVEAAIVKAGSEAFVSEGEELQICVCALVAALELIKEESHDPTGWSAADALAAGLWSALAFQLPLRHEPLELLRQEALSGSRARVMKSAELSRRRASVPEIGLLTIPESAPAGSRANAAFKRATEPMVKALKDNAELDREELEFLWWALSDWSDTLELPLGSLGTTARAVVCGIDGGFKLRRLPATGHRNVVLRGIPAGEETTLIEVREAIKPVQEALASRLPLDRVSRALSVYPLLSSLTDRGHPRNCDEIRLSARDWGARAMLETAILRMNERHQGAQ